MVAKLQNCREVCKNQEFLIARLNEFINAIPKNSADDIYEAYTHRFDEIKNTTSDILCILASARE